MVACPCGKVCLLARVATNGHYHLAVHCWLCVGCHRAGFSTILVPGSGEPNFDSYVANPYASLRERREQEVAHLLDKLQPGAMLQIAMLQMRCCRTWTLYLLPVRVRMMGLALRIAKALFWLTACTAAPVHMLAICRDDHCLHVL